MRHKKLIIQLISAISLISGSIFFWNLPPEPVDYNRLNSLLASGDWQEADRETRELIIRLVTNKNDWQILLLRFDNLTIQDWTIVDAHDLEKIPCQDLLEIDRLWSQHSQKRFGFSSQAKIWQNFYREQDLKYIHLFKQEEYIADKYYLFEERVGWIDLDLFDTKNIENNITYNIKAPQGHLPSPLWMTEDTSVKSFWGNAYSKIRFMSNRIEACYSTVEKTNIPTTKKKN